MNPSEDTALATQGPVALERVPATIYEVLGDLARDPNVDVTRIAALMDLQIKAEDRQAEREFNAAFARLQPMMPRISKKGKIDMGAKGSMSFARYEDLDKALRPLYVAEGFSLSFISEPSEKGIVLVAVLAHSAGHQKTSRLQLPADAGAGRNPLQALGSSLSYARRYLTCDIFNVITVGEDTDANLPEDSLTQEQVDDITRLIQECNMNDAAKGKFLKFMEVEAIKDITQGAYAPAMNYLQAMRRKAGRQSE